MAVRGWGQKMALEMDKKKKRRKEEINGFEVKARGGSGDLAYHSVNHIDDNLAMSIDNKNTLLRMRDQLAKLEKTKDVQGFLQDIAPDVAAKLLLKAMSGDSDKVQLEAIRDLLDRAGYGKVTKHAVARFDASQSKDTIISTILGTKKDLKKAGIEIVDDDQDIEKGSGETS